MYALDVEPGTQTSWGTHELPCACFIYTRTADFDDPRFRQSGTLDSPSMEAAQAWRHVALCHISSTLEYLDLAASQARMWDEATDLSHLHKAPAPSFQHSSLGPALFLSEHGLLPPISRVEFDRALGSGQPKDLIKLLRKVGLGPGQPSCTQRADLVLTACPNPEHQGPFGQIQTGHHRLRVEALPYSMFPPGRTFFDPEEREHGVEPCVVHANYATNHWKEKLLRDAGLWALDWTGDEPVCRVDVARRGPTV